MKKILCGLLTCLLVFSYSGCAMAINEAPSQAKALQAAPNAKSIEFAFVFDGPSDKNNEVLQVFQKTITKSLLPDFKAVFPKDLVFTGDWSNQGAINASNKALASRAFMVISLGYLSSEYYSNKNNKNKFVVTIDQYGLRDFGDNFFNPIQQSVSDFLTFQKLVPNIKKSAILMNENFYKNRNDWNSTIAKKLKEKNCNLNFVVIPVNSNVKASLAKIPADVDSVFVTPLFNLSNAQRKELYKYINDKKLPSFSAVGKEDVDMGAMLGTSTFEADKKIAEATSFNIHGVLHGNAVKNEKIPFYDDKVIFYNADTGEAIGYVPPLRLLNNSVTISHKELPKYDLSYLLNTLDDNNLDIARKKFLISAARRSVTSAYLRYLPTLRLDLGYQTYNSAYAESYSNVPTRVGQFTVGMDQVIYSPDLVTNIIVKHKKLKFDKAEEALTRANMEYQTGSLYIDMLMLENMIKVQEEFVQETRENLAIARVREKTGKCGYEEVLRWAGEVSESEKKLLSMKADYKNIKININKLLYKDQKQDFNLAPLTASDPAFFTSDLHIIDHVRNPEKLGKFTDMLVDEVIYLSPETTKLKAAIAMKKAEISNYAQKFVMPNAKLSLEYGTQFDRHLPYETEGNLQMASTYAQTMGMLGSPWLNLNTTSGRFLIAAQWKPIEGGHKIAEIARCKSELNELHAYLDEVNTEIEMQVRSVVNRAISKYFIIEKSYKAMFAQAENYQTVKNKYLMGQVPINQIADAQSLYFQAKLDALNSQYEFYKELIWVQRGLLAVNWTKASPDAKKWIKGIPAILPAEEDFSL
ncbi:TolC family protein [bacterium]|nr:TolC family protein [bacterium]